MPRPLLEIWQKLNRTRDGAPSSLLREGKPLSAVEQMTARIARDMQSPEYRRRQALAKIFELRQQSPTQRALSRLGRQMESPEYRRRQQERQLIEHALGTPRPVPPAKTDSPAKSKSSGGRPPKLPPEIIENAIHFLRNQPKKSVDAACTTLEKQFKIKVGRATWHRRVIQPAYNPRRPA